MLRGAEWRPPPRSARVPVAPLVAAAAKALPFRDGAFQAAVANHMLVHVTSVRATLGEIARVMAPVGVPYAATTGREPMRERLDVALWCRPSAAAVGAPAVSRFSLESAPKRRSPRFEDVRRLRDESPIAVNFVER